MKVFGFRIAKISTLEKETDDAIAEHKWRLCEAAEAEFRKNGYVEWVAYPPPTDKKFLLIRYGWYWPELTSATECSSYANAVGAFWVVPQFEIPHILH